MWNCNNGLDKQHASSKHRSKHDALLINSIPTVVKLVSIETRACSSSCGGEHAETLPVFHERPLLSFVEAHIDLFCCQGEENFCLLAPSPCQMRCLGRFLLLLQVAV